MRAIDKIALRTQWNHLAMRVISVTYHNTRPAVGSTRSRQLSPSKVTVVVQWQRSVSLGPSEKNFLFLKKLKKMKNEIKAKNYTFFPEGNDNNRNNKMTMERNEWRKGNEWMDKKRKESFTLKFIIIIFFTSPFCYLFVSYRFFFIWPTTGNGAKYQT